jgi:hypothetical protein
VVKVSDLPILTYGRHTYVLCKKTDSCSRELKVEKSGGRRSDAAGDYDAMQCLKIFFH